MGNVVVFLLLALVAQALAKEQAAHPSDARDSMKSKMVKELLFNRALEAWHLHTVDLGNTSLAKTATTFAKTQPGMNQGTQYIGPSLPALRFPFPAAHSSFALPRYLPVSQGVKRAKDGVGSLRPNLQFRERIYPTLKFEETNYEKIHPVTGKERKDGFGEHRRRTRNWRLRNKLPERRINGKARKRMKNDLGEQLQEAVKEVIRLKLKRAQKEIRRLTLLGGPGLWERSDIKQLEAELKSLWDVPYQKQLETKFERSSDGRLLPEAREADVKLLTSSNETNAARMVTNEVPVAALLSANSGSEIVAPSSVTALVPALSEEEIEYEEISAEIETWMRPESEQATTHLGKKKMIKLRGLQEEASPLVGPLARVETGSLEIEEALNQFQFEAGEIHKMLESRNTPEVCHAAAEYYLKQVCNIMLLEKRRQLTPKSPWDGDILWSTPGKPSALPSPSKKMIGKRDQFRLEMTKMLESAMMEKEREKSSFSGMSLQDLREMTSEEIEEEGNIRIEEDGEEDNISPWDADDPR